MKRLGELTEGIVQKALSDGLPDSPAPEMRADAILPVAVKNGGGFETLYQQAVEKGDVDTLTRLMDLEERYIRRQAEFAFNAAKGRILKKLSGIKIVKNKWVQYHEEKNNPKSPLRDAFKYAPLEEIHNVLSPLLTEEEMDLAYSDEPTADGRIMIRGRLKHLPGGHYEDSFMAAPMDTSGGKNNVQAVGSTNSYLRRYVACNIFDIVVVGDDDDGIGGQISDEQVQELLALMKAASAGPKFLKYMHLPPVEDGGSPEDSIAAMPARDYRKARKTLEDLVAKASSAAPGARR